MRRAHKCATAKGRASVAIALIRLAAGRRWHPRYRNECPFPRAGRAWDDCFECGDGGDVVHLLRRAILSDPTLAQDVRALSYYMPAVLIEAAEAGGPANA